MSAEVQKKGGDGKVGGTSSSMGFPLQERFFYHPKITGDAKSRELWSFEMPERDLRRCCAATDGSTQYSFAFYEKCSGGILGMCFETREASSRRFTITQNRIEQERSGGTSWSKT